MGSGIRRLRRSGRASRWRSPRPRARRHARRQNAPWRRLPPLGRCQRPSRSLVLVLGASRDCSVSVVCWRARRSAARPRGHHDKHHWGGPPLRILCVRRISAGGAPRPRAPHRRYRLQDATSHATPDSGRSFLDAATFDDARPDMDTSPTNRVGLRENSIVPRATRFSSTEFLWRLRAAKTLCR
jgi:hypothetical protein